MLSDLKSHWEKRNRNAITKLDPARIDREQFLDLPPGTRDGETFEVDLGHIGIANLLLEVRVIVA